ncbi:ABC transporter ATP-binding protein [Megamonas hypermegale]|uniref:ABC transporter ATP-binding protein n=1 Tax=Megamonas hypermegale TaxID=158847 RepID=UPI0026F2BE8F|nr:ABC transporter ATP-binding protein [Megamonas hypermegale]
MLSELNTTNNIAIELKNVKKEFFLYRNEKEKFLSIFFKRKIKKHLTLQNINLKIFKGEVVGIVGKNGAGKSTLLKIITGVTFPTSGEVIVNGRVGALLELTAGFKPEMTGRENIYLKGTILGLKNNEISLLEKDIIDFADIGEYIDQPVRTYSSGMKVRLGFSINVNIKPDILIIDEALSVGDNEFKKKCKKKIQELIKEHITVLFVSHNEKTVNDFCTRVLYLEKGLITNKNE